MSSELNGSWKDENGSFFSLGLETHKIPMLLYKENREIICKAFRENYPEKADGGVALFKGACSQERNDSDRELLVRQESYFAFLFGVTEPDFYGAVRLDTGHTTLFMPRLPESYAIWMGRIRPPSYFQARYAVEEVFYVDQIPEALQQADTQVVFLMSGVNSDSSTAFPTPDLAALWPTFHSPGKSSPHSLPPEVDLQELYPLVQEARVIKSPLQIDVLRYVARISSQAHVHVMQNTCPGMAEYQLESLFQHYCYFHGGCRHMSYICICATGANAAVLHYGSGAFPNQRVFQDGDMALLDMGAEYACFCSDITCSFPVNGIFTPDQRMVYQAVLDAQLAVMAVMRPGVEWTEMHLLAERTILAALLEAQLLTGTLYDLTRHHIGAVFMPHGLGHLLGLDTHDVGGYPAGRARVDSPGLRSLRMNRCLEEGMVLTVEPGCYFVQPLLDQAMSAPATRDFFVKENIERFRNFGGVRLEDDVLVTSNGIENLTICPRLIEDVEAVMAGSPWPAEPVVGGKPLHMTS
mmetsp:Transcript_28697/g.39646  ORF Transcript_28697/g.39646 Transcript_28697/m.39646 type:complete len:523 (-) Transcript_28697:154-1722(-)|eukprot:CAMPEP_0196586096 /NCGR_PEP_ID=MMETSP1081-20130531/53090_1 /TAXON_ID=36882 /ORGANISM="Pyramimonas amylifera, Strain CCMP720" /LENGTH=522 /DNA_ID=CAMNT_0041907855 /DNA_START=807 /DNA_END=2375 /DNA_ORIENTATION=+